MDELTTAHRAKQYAEGPFCDLCPEDARAAGAPFDGVHLEVFLMMCPPSSGGSWAAPPAAATSRRARGLARLEVKQLLQMVCANLALQFRCASVLKSFQGIYNDFTA